MAELLYKNISNDLMAQVRTGHLEIGAKLSERSLAEQYGVSRTVIRDALKVLNEKGYVEIRQGRGHYVKQPGAHEIQAGLGNVIANSSVSFQEVREARILLESAMVDLIMERVSAEDIRALEEIYGRMESMVHERQFYGELDQSFHVRLMECGRNEMMNNFIQTLNEALDRNYILWDLSVRIEAQEEHAQMLECLRNRDAEGLRQALIQHTSSI